ncbi:MAG: hypothetical protein SAJ37_21845 [Oscillatoria sp. PMC 1068.18]|nr:hypothetical protein [Oscillatoria sp. PMC 1076.18]MEC4991386.1 hypothetical protein [Oscillatoria sp. PMC 1068.18]
MFKKFTYLIFGSSACLLFSLPVQAQTYLQYAETYWLVKNSLHAARGEQVNQDRDTTIIFALQQNPDTLKEDTIKLLRQSREAMKSASIERACYGYAFLTNARSILLEDRRNYIDIDIDSCRSLSVRSFMNILDDEYRQIYRALD